MKCAVAPRNDTKSGSDHTSVVSDTRPSDRYRNHTINNGMPILRADPAHLQLPIELIPLRLPCLDYARCHARPPGDLTIRNTTLSEVEKQLAEERTLDYMD